MERVFRIWPRLRFWSHFLLFVFVSFFFSLSFSYFFSFFFLIMACSDLVRDGMFGTLVIQLPSSYTGGDCTVQFSGML
jgi:hypothetical protein